MFLIPCQAVEAPLCESFLHLVLILQLAIFPGALYLSVYLLFFRFGTDEENSFLFIENVFELFGYQGFLVWEGCPFFGWNNVIHTKGDV